MVLKMNHLKILFCFLILSSPLIASETLSDLPMQRGYVYQEGRLISRRDLATMSVQEHFSEGMAALENRRWRDAVHHFRVITINFPSSSSFSEDAFFFLGKSYLHRGDPEMANHALTTYLEQSQNPKYFEEAILCKFYAAESFRKGAKRRIFGSKRMPKCLPGTKVALALYDEVAAAMPHSDIGAQALFSKGNYLNTMSKHSEAIDCFQKLIRNNPLHEHAPESFLLISKTYYKQSKTEFQNPDLLPLSEINLRRFQEQFPNEERLTKAEVYVQKIQEVYAQGLYDTGQFYERTKKPKASVFYYYKTIKRFPNTTVAKACQQRLQQLQEYVQELQLPMEELL